MLSQKAAAILEAFKTYDTIDNLCRALASKEITPLHVLQTVFTEKELLYSQAKILMGMRENSLTYVMITIRMRPDPEGLKKILRIFLNREIFIESIKKLMEHEINRIRYSFLITIPQFSDLYTLCEQLNTIPEIESIIKE